MEALFVGLGLGLTAGISPGPLLALVITSSLQGGLRHGVAVALAPLLSDLVVVVTVLLTLGRVPERGLSWLGVVGGLVVVLMGLQTVRTGRRAALVVHDRDGATPTAALGRALLVNVLSPHPWISWLTALGPLTVATWRASHAAGVLFVGGFYLTLVGSKVGIAALVAGGRRQLGDAGYRRAVIAAGAALAALGVLLVVEFAGPLQAG